ncbi:hypothetical protein [Paractinoplanes deccanensis]|nr:hypothetical protein [Actinoplanes deccanensis]
MTAGLIAVPSAASAAGTTTSLSAAQMSAALKAVAATSTAATAKGWKATISLTGALSAAGLYVVDPAAGVVFDRTVIAGQLTADYAVAGKGLYGYLADPSSRSAVKMMGRPSVRYVFAANKALKLDTYVQDSGVSPATVLTEDVDHAGTRTVHDDASVDYQYRDGDGATVKMHVSEAGLLTTAQASGDGLGVTLAYAYAPQRVTVPPASATIGSAALAQGVAYLDMPALVKKVARQGAADARRAAHGHKVKVTSLRKVVRRDVAALNASIQVPMVKTRNVAKGVRVSATNPWTRKTISYTLKASGTKVVLTKS